MYVCVCVCLVGVMNGLGTCIIDPFLQASCTWTGIKMIHGPFPGLIPLILRYQPAALCGRGGGGSGGVGAQSEDTEQDKRFLR